MPDLKRDETLKVPTEPLRRRRGGVREQAAIATRVKILFAAERLFAEKGFDAVSLREISGAAEQGNSNAVQYHFGTKEKLICAAFELRGYQFEPIRAAMLARAEEAGRLSNARTLIEILFLPFLLARGETGGHSFAGFMVQYQMKQRTAGIPHPFDDGERVPPALQQTRDLLRQRLAYLPDEVFRYRLGMAALSFSGMLVRWDTEVEAGLEVRSLRLLVADTIVQVTEALCCPQTFDEESIFDVLGLELTGRRRRGPDTA